MPLPRPLRPRNVRAAAGVVARLSPLDLARGRLVLRVDGFRMEVPRDRLWAFVGGTYYEQNVRHWWLRFVKRLRKPVVYDLGAHAGYYTLSAAAAGARSVVAFEPAPKTYAVLKRNVARSGRRNVRTFELALSDHEGTADLRLYAASGNNSLVPRPLPHLVARGSIRVRVRPLDDVVRSERLELPGLLKLDVEGSELAALRGARDVLKRAKPVIFMEYWREGAVNAGHSLHDLERELHRHGYRLFGLSQDLDDLRLHPEADWAGTGVGNVIAVPPGVDPS